MQTSHDSNGQNAPSSITGNGGGVNKLHGNDLSGGGHETMVSPVASAAAVGGLSGVSSASVMGAPGATSYGAQLGTATQMLGGGDNYSGYQNMFAPDYLPFGMYGYYGNHSQGLGDASTAPAAGPQSSLWSGAGTGAGNTTQNDLSLSFLNFHTAPGGAPSYPDYYYSFNAAQPHYNTWGQPTASSAAPIDYTDLSAGWGQALGAPTPNSAPHEPSYTTGGTGGATNGSALLKEFSAANVSVSQQQQQNNSNMFVNGGGLADFSVPTSVREPQTVTSSEMCGALEQSFSQFGLGGHSPSGLIPSPPQVQHQPPPPQSNIRSDESHFPGLGASVPASVSQQSLVQQPISAVSTVPSGGGGGGGGKKTWASIASQPAKGSAATLGVIPGPGNRKMPGPGLGPPKPPGRGTPTVLRPNMPWESTGGGGHGNGKSGGSRGRSMTTQSPSTQAPGVLFTNEELASKNFNPRTFDLNPKTAKFFVIKSYSEDDIHRSIKYQIWCSTEHGNKKLDAAFHEMDSRGPVYLFFSVNGSGHFCGVAQMASRVDYDTRAGVWCQDKWKGEFRVKWIYVKDVPNSQLRHIRLETNENKPVTNSRDATEVPLEKGRLVLKVIHIYKHTTSIFDDFSHYERREEQENQKRNNGGPAIGAGSNTFSH